ncbi:hypothetical protein Tco_1148043 [Tanacetum coccineum]
MYERLRVSDEPRKEGFSLELKVYRRIYVKVSNWVQQTIDVETTSNNDARDQASELEFKVLVDGKQDETKVVKVVGMTDEQNSDKLNMVECNRVIGVRANGNKKGVDKEVQYSIYTLHVIILFLKRLNDKKADFEGVRNDSPMDMHWDFMMVLLKASGDSDQDAKDALSKLL